MRDDTSHSNSGWIFFAGIATGAVLGYLLNTDRGRQLRTEYADSAKQAIQHGWENASTSVQSAIEKGKHYASDLSGKLQTKLNRASDAAHEGVEAAESAFQRGSDRAKSRMQEISAS